MSVPDCEPGNHRPEPEACARCDGAGRVWVHFGDHVLPDEECPRCEGAGVVEHPRQEQP